MGGEQLDIDSLTVVAVSHNKSFLDAVTTDTLELKNGKLAHVPGPYSVFERAQEDLLAHHRAMHASQEKRRRQLHASIQKTKQSVRRHADHEDQSKSHKFDVFQRQVKAGQVKNLHMKLDKLGAAKTADGKRWKQSYMGERQKVQLQMPDPPVEFDLPAAAPLAAAGSFMQADDAWFSYDLREREERDEEDKSDVSLEPAASSGAASPEAVASSKPPASGRSDKSDRETGQGQAQGPVPAPTRSPRWTLRGVTLAVRPGDRIAIVGANGQGKSTLVKMLLGALRPQRGTSRRNPLARIRHFSQHHLGGGDLKNTAMRFLRESHPGIFANEKEALTLLGKFGVKGEAATRPMGSLSGGQRCRVVLASIAAEPTHAVVLDEPLHYLDFESIRGLTSALQSFEGSAVVVSHNLGFLREVCGEGDDK